MTIELTEESYVLGDDYWTRDNLFWGKKGEEVTANACRKAFPEWTVKHNNFGNQYEYCCSSGVDITITREDYNPIVMEVKNLNDQPKPYGTDFVKRHILPRFYNLGTVAKVLIITFLHLLTQKAIQLLRDNDIQTIEVGERLTTQYQISNKIHILANKLKHHIQPTKKAPLLVKPIVPLNQYMCCKSSGTQDKNNYTIPLSDKEILIGLKEVVKPHIEVNHPCQLGHPDHERWMQQENERLEKYRY